MLQKPVIYILIALFTLAATLQPSEGYARKNAIRQDAKLVVHVTASGLRGLLKHAQNKDEQILLIRAYVHAARFFNDESGYFFVFDMNGICVAHGMLHELEGQNKDAVDARTGKPIVLKMVELSQSGGGFIEYMWPKPDNEGTHKKLGYVEPIPGTDFFIGTGVYFPNLWPSRP